jgi:SHS2 domain-containing protein
MRPAWRSEEHVGEWKLTVWADSREELLAAAAGVLARRCGVAAAPGGRPPGPWRRVAAESRDAAGLLVDWLNELIALCEIHGEALGEVRDIRIDGGRAEGWARGPRVGQWRSPVKAATLHGAEMARRKRRWRATVLLDV